MTFRSDTLKRQITRICLILCTLMAFSARAIVSYEPLPLEVAPLLPKALKDGHAEYYKRYKLELTDTSRLRSFWFRIQQDDIEPAFKEILLAQLNGYNRENHVHNMLSEFQRLQADLLERGYEPSTNQYWAPAQELSIGWNIKHEYFEFDLRLNYQPINQPLQDHQSYPRASLKGILIFKCTNPVESAERFDNCLVYMAEIQSASIEWHSIPGNRGGNSSAGGGVSKQEIMNFPLIIQNTQMANSLGLLKSQKKQIKRETGNKRQK